MSRIIMYHYIRHYNKELPFFRYLNIKNFKNQISYFKKRYTFLKIGEDFKKIAKRNTLSLSFDDGLKDHFQVAKFLHPKKY